jgi:hypothetical protein
MIPHHIVFIHGIGDEPGGYSAWIKKRIFAAFSKSVYRLTRQSPPEDSLHFVETLWSSVTQEQQDDLWNTLFPKMETKGMPMRLSWKHILREFLTDLLLDPKRWWYQLRYWSWVRKTIVVYQGDLIAYIESPGQNKYKAIHEKVYGDIKACAKRTVETEATVQNPALMTIVAHSLGSVIASDLLYDTLERKNRWWPAQIRLANFFSLGCPLSLYTLRYKDSAVEFKHPVRMQDPHGLWINIYDRQDVIGYPLKLLNQAYNDAVFVDKEISLGHWWNFWHLLLRNTPFNHYMYWEDYAVAKIIGKKAALDWLQTNRLDLAGELKPLYDKYMDDMKPRSIYYKESKKKADSGMEVTDARCDQGNPAL